DENDPPTTHHRSSPTSPFVGRAILAAYDTAVVGTNCSEVLLTLAAMLSSVRRSLRHPARAEDRQAEAVVRHATHASALAQTRRPTPEEVEHDPGEGETNRRRRRRRRRRVPPHHRVTTWPSLIRVFDAYITSGEDPQWCRRNNPRLRSLRAALSIREHHVEVVRVRGLGSCCRGNSDLPGRVHRGGGSSGINGGRRATRLRYDMTARTVAIAVVYGGNSDDDDDDEVELADSYDQARRLL
ncbi:hypothetical protein HK405_004348, partial [Cladochytrium tenue]